MIISTLGGVGVGAFLSGTGAGAGAGFLAMVITITPGGGGHYILGFIKNRFVIEEGLHYKKKVPLFN